ncbi:GHMP Kinase, C-terminal domain-containing protein [Fistulina hepatica ATCC 64428]|uniref:GHMP Kinase, C-terminal domain-containing protein n=1 Tax=Fistulina hepatica ATCC 64428 TaxID=1128425 RepID=A0A0D7AI39_9AGAR|nr:GHMP Kinase, C-terminal domain-containing protein [Fistulina hepatica ATCC 64428]
MSSKHYGGSSATYTRADFNKPSNIVPIQGFKSLKFLLTNTKVPRDTKKLVAGVGELKRQQPETVEQVLAEVQNISDEARRALGDPEMSRDLLLKTLSTLMDANHSNLVTLGVSHPSLEAVREITRADGLSTKLTGAGGGGCSVTLVPDGVDALTPYLYITLTCCLSRIRLCPP